MLTAITAPTTTNLMDPETVLARLKLADSELEDLTETVAEASAVVARYLGYECAYGTWQETFSGISGDRLYLGARPAWSVESVTYRDGSVPQAADSYRLERGRYGESWITGPWTLYGASPVSWIWRDAGVVVASAPATPDWSVDFTAGWWLPEMTGEVPEGVETLPRELQADFLRIVRWLRSAGGDIGELAAMGISRMKNEGAEVEFQAAKDRAMDPSGIPASCLVSLPLYRRVG